MTKPAELYHGRRYGRGVELDQLEPTTVEGQVRNGRFGQFLYATHRLDQAMLYTLPFTGVAGSFMDTLDGGPDETLIRFDARPSEAARAPLSAGLVHAMSSEGFEQVEANPREWIKESAAKAWTKTAVKGLDDVLSAGVQYITLAPGRDPADFVDFADQSRRDGLTSRDAVARGIAGPDPLFVWENERSGLGADPRLTELVAGFRAELGASTSLSSGSLSERLAQRREAKKERGPELGRKGPAP